MHPSSFYDLRARYVYTPLHGPYSLSEALEGLIFYPLNKSQDFISIGTKRLLRHELVSELSNVVDDLQDYLLYFSSTFLISPSVSPDLIKELQTSCEDFKYLIICWGALITRLVTARKIVECYFWPHFFHPSIDKLTSLRKLKQRPPFPITPAFSANSPSPVQRLPLLKKHSEPPQSTSSETDLTGDKEGHTSSLRLDATLAPSGSCSTRIPPNHQPSSIALDPSFPQLGENRSDEVFASLNGTIAKQQSRNSTAAPANDTRRLRDLKDDAKMVGINEKATEVEVAVEEAGVTRPPYARSHPVQLTPSQDITTGELITMPPRTSTGSQPSPTESQPSSTEPQPSSTELQPLSTGLQPSSTMLRPSTVLQPSTALRLSPTALWPSPTAPQFASRGPYIPCSIPNLHFGPTTPLPHSIPLPHSFVNAISNRSVRFPPNRQHPQHSTSTIPSHSLSSA